MLVESDVVHLYKMKFNPSLHFKSTKGRSGPISKLFGISPRAVRDVWNRKTWTYATKHLWPCEDSFAHGGNWTESIEEVFLALRFVRQI